MGLMVAAARVLPLCALVLALPFMMLSGLAYAQGRPVFDYPADKQIIGSIAPWRFKVQPMANAQGFSWSILQNGRQVSERIKTNKGNEFEIYPGDVNHSQIVLADPIEVRVRALIAGKWTDPTIITVRAYEPPPVKAPQRPSTQPPRFTFADAVLLFLFVLPLPMTYAIVRYKRHAAAEHAQRIEAAYKWALGNAHLPGPLKQPAEQLCLDILSYDGVFQNRRHSPQSIKDVLHTWLYYLLHNNDRKPQLPNLLASAAGGEATFSVPLYRLHADIPDAIDGVFDTLDQKFSRPDSERPLPRLGVKLYLNAAGVAGIDPASGEKARKPVVNPIPREHRNKSPSELISRFLGETPFVDFLQTELNVSIPHHSRFEHTHIVGGTGHGKTQLLQYLILNDLPHVAARNRSVIVIDSQGSDSQRGLIKNILSLASVGAMADRVVLIDPNEYIPALNLFDFGLDRLKGYADQQKRKQVLNGAIELYAYMFGALLRAELTMRQDVIFSNLARLMMVVPGATLDNLLDFLKHPELTRRYIQKLDAYGQRFFETEFFASKYNDTREQLATRVWGVLTQSELASMFAAERNKVDMFAAMNRGSLILISTNKRYLNQDASEIFGRFFIALIRQATRERELGDQDKLRDTFVYIDEAHEYFDESMGSLFEQARKFQVGMVIAHQHLGQFQKELRDTVMGNTSVKIAGGVSYDDARDFAKVMRCEPEFLLGMQKYLDPAKPDQARSEFACYVKDYTTTSAIPLSVPFFKMDKQPKMTEGGRDALIAENRRRYGASNGNPPDKPKDDDSPLGDPELL